MKNLYLGNKYEKKFKRLRFFTIFLFFLLGATIFLNLDYFIFKFLISQNYIFTKSLDAIYDQALGEGNYKGYYKNFDEVVMSVFTEKIRQIDNDRYTYLYSPYQYKISKETEKTEAADAKIEIINTNSIYVLIPNISKYTKQFLIENIDLLKNHKNIIIDLRDNHGGSLKDLYQMENLFIQKGSTLGFETTRIKLFTKEIIAKKNKELNFKNIIILQNESSASAAEGFIMSLKENLNNVTTIGTTTFGKGIGQITIPLTSGYAIKSTVLTVETPDYNSIHNTGIKPDIEYINEDIIEYAILLLDEK